MTTQPSLLCDASHERVHADIERALAGKPLTEQRVIVSGWISHIRTITGDQSLGEQGRSYMPDAKGRPILESPEETLRANTRILTKALTRMCPER